ncbi:MAG: PorT family protein [Sphingobacteriales bacterium]|nr:PorT family protein [Sphingobacteriales bacterium]
MTKKFFLFTVIYLSAVIANAQNVRTLIRAGVNATNGTISIGDYKGSSSYLPGGFVGFQFKVFFEPPVYFSPQINLLHKGAEFKINNGTDTSNLRLELNQIQLAPFLQYDFHKPGEPGLFLNGSLSLYAAINGKETITKTNGSKVKSNMRFSKTAYDRFEAGAHIGIGYETNKWQAQLMYNRGLSNTYNGDNSEFYTGPKIKYHTLSFGIAWYLN